MSPDHTTDTIRLRAGRSRADASGVHHPSFRRVTWDGEEEQHWMPAAAPFEPGTPMLCGKRLPPFDGVTEDEAEFKTTPVCRRCNRAFWKIFRRARDAFAAAVEGDLEKLPTLDLPDHVSE
jgi:hypothetical protein